MGRAPCCEKDGVKKGPWTPEEDQKLMDYIQKNGYGNWRTLPKNAGLQRCGKSCRLRWTNYLRPDIKRGRFSVEEDEAIVHLHSILGNKWSAIAARLPGRTDNEIKNYWNTHIRKRLLRMGIDPLTHTPRLHHFNQINPDFLTFANSFLSSDDRYRNQLMQIFPQFPPSLPLQDFSIPTLSSIFQDQAQQLMQYDQNLAEFGSTQLNDGSVYSCVTTEDHAALPSYGSVETETNSSTFQSNGGYNSNMCLQSAVVSNISTPSSSPTPLHSERVNYCSSLLKYGIPQEILDVADFI